MRILKIIILLVIAAVLLAFAGFTIWAYTPLGPMPEALAALESDDQIQVETSPWITFTPVDTNTSTAFILYPGGRVDPRSYAPTARAIAEEGFLVIIPPMPFNLAVFDADVAAEIMNNHQEISSWIIGGHSLGGAMAAEFIGDQPGAIDALVLWAAYPADSNDLSTLDDTIFVSIFASNDGLATTEKIDASRPLLPANTRWDEISGGNHAQFGWYGPQSGDGEATISRQEQQEQIVVSTMGALRQITGDGR
jgi:pimeloyl-ACP methyl ester carboxylesterase